MNTKLLLIVLLLLQNNKSNPTFEITNSCKPKIIQDTIKERYKASNGTLLLNSNITYPIVKYHCNDNITTIINRYFQNKLKDMKEYEKDAYLTAKNFYENYPNSALLPYTIEVNFTTELNTSKLLSFKLLSNSYLGGAHSNPTTKGVTFDLVNEQVLNFDNIYINDKKIVNSKINFLIEKYIYDNNLTNKLFPFEKGKLPLPYENNFFLTPKEITYIYNPYEIAPYATGILYIPIKFEQLDTILKPSFKKLIR